MKKSLVAMAVVLGIASTMYGASTDKSKKDIQIVAASDAQSRTMFETRRGSLFKFVVPATEKVEVGEPIKVALKLKKKAYIYMIAVSEKNNKAYLILPNKYDKYNRYRARTHYVIPERSSKYKFVSDSAGTETIYVIASRHKQSFKQLLEKFGTTEVAGFRMATAKGAQTFMKDILIVPAKKKKTDIEVRKIDIKVHAKNQPAAQTDPDVRVFLSTGKTHYKTGEKVTTMLQGNRDGYVSLYIINPDKSRDFIKTVKIKKNKPETVKMKAQKAAGTHQILAYFSHKKPENAEKHNKKGQSKNLTLVSDADDAPLNSHTVIITEK